MGRHALLQEPRHDGGGDRDAPGRGLSPARRAALPAGESAGARDVVHRRIDLPRRQHLELLRPDGVRRSEEHTSELQSRQYLVCRLLLEKKKITDYARPAVMTLCNA